MATGYYHNAKQEKQPSRDGLIKRIKDSASFKVGYFSSLISQLAYGYWVNDKVGNYLRIDEEGQITQSPSANIDVFPIPREEYLGGRLEFNRPLDSPIDEFVANLVHFHPAYGVLFALATSAVVGLATYFLTRPFAKKNGIDEVIEEAQTALDEKAKIPTTPQPSLSLDKLVENKWLRDREC